MNKNKIFLVDTENIGTRFLEGKEELTQKDLIILFENSNEKTIIQILTSLNRCNAHIEVKKMNLHTKNAMDFQICTLLGMLINQYGEEYEYHIVSLDRGYESSIEFIKQNTSEKILIDTVISLNCNKAGDMAKRGINELLEGFSKKAKKEAALGLRKTQDLCSYHNYLQANLPIDGQKIYKLVKNQYEILRLAL